jgi:hypothetical protein
LALIASHGIPQRRNAISSARVRASSSKVPRIALVTVVLFCF